MKKGENTNHPIKGSIIKVEPIRLLNSINEIKELLLQRKKKRNYALFVIGINTNLRASDLRQIRWGQVRSLSSGDSFLIREQKTRKVRRVIINSESCRAIQLLMDEYKDKDSDYPLFPCFSSKTPITIMHMHRLVKSWCKTIGLRGNYGSHTLRKTWGYHQRVTYNVGIAELMICFNHSSQEETLGYLCIDEKEIDYIFMEGVL